ncbi:MAG: Bax inhibitor-1/YccA family protein [Pseudomonadales bacterium]|nr:Bax inhibitor-1/YccA family protein [Pseudomonadales bacterium]
MADNRYIIEGQQESALATNKVLRNTYMLLSLTLVFSTVTAWVAVATHAQPMGFIPLLIGFYGLFFLTSKLSNSVWGLVSTFALTGFMGYTLGPIVGFYLSMSNGSELVMTALGMAAMVFLGLSGYALVTRKDFSFLAGFITAGFFVLLGAMIVSFIWNISGLSLAISAGFVLFSSAAILLQTGQIINGGERNYIMATITLYVSIYNLFLSLLHILGVMGDD